MGLCKKLLFLTTVVGVVYIAYLIHKGSDPPPLPVLKEDFWWGPGEAKKVDESIRPFKIQVSNEVITDLNERLDRYLKKLPTPPLENQGFQYGFNTDYLRSVISHWRSKYQWKDREALLNQYPQFKTNVQGLDIHFIRVTPKNPSGKKVIPLLLLHGWPGSVKEFYGIIPLLTTPRSDADFVFEVIAPSLPGYGFSDGASKVGLGPTQIAVIMNNLMKRIGFDKYYVQGGDWGSIITKAMGQLYPKRVLGVHSNMCFTNTMKSNLKWFLGAFWPSLVVDEKLQHMAYPIWPKFKFILEETGYFHIQATKPDTIGAVLKDTPAGLAAYILEKFSTWTNPEWKSLPDGGLTKKFKLDDLLDNIMIYWVSNSITTSQRLYSEAFSLAHLGLRLDDIPITVPTACARFHKDLNWQSEYILKDSYQNLLQVNDFPNGGHFAAMEVPKDLSEDIWSAIKKFQTYHNQKKLNKN